MLSPINHAISPRRGLHRSPAPLSCTALSHRCLHSQTPMPSQQLSITLDEDLVAFLDQQGSNRSAAIAEAVRCWRDQQWLDEVNQAYDQEAHP
jgi:hypothetical protein